jgi:hypothetical protein
MASLRTESEQGSGMISSLVGLIFVVAFLVAAAKLTKIVLVEQRLNALATDSARRLGTAGALQSQNSLNQVEGRIAALLPAYANDLSFSLEKNGDMLDFQIHLSNYSVTFWPNLGTRLYTLTASATSHIES